MNQHISEDYACFYFLPYFLKIIYLFLAVQCLHCCTGFSLVVANRGSSPAVHRLTEVASLIVEHKLQGAPASVIAAHGLSGCVSWLQSTCSGVVAHRLSAHSIWNLPRPEIKPVFCIGRWISTTVPPEKCRRLFLKLPNKMSKTLVFETNIL